MLLNHGMNDPRVDVWHSAKAAARLQAASSSGKPVLLRLDRQAGHGIGSTDGQRTSKQADTYSFLLWQFGKTDLAPCARLICAGRHPAAAFFTAKAQRRKYSKAQRQHAQRHSAFVCHRLWP